MHELNLDIYRLSHLNQRKNENEKNPVFVDWGAKPSSLAGLMKALVDQIRQEETANTAQTTPTFHGLHVQM